MSPDREDITQEEPERETPSAKAEPEAPSAEVEPGPDASEVEAESAADTVVFETLSISPVQPLGQQHEPAAEALAQLPEAIGAILGQLLDRKIAVSAPKMAVLSKEQVLGASSSGVAVVHTTYSQGLKGQLFFLSKNRTASALAALILGTPVEGHDDELSEESKDAFLGLVKQICAKVNSGFSELQGTSVATGPFLKYDPSTGDLAQLYPEGDLIAAEMSITGPEKLEGTLLFLLPVSVADQLAEGKPDSGPEADDLAARAGQEAPRQAGQAPASPPAQAPDMDERLQVIMGMEIPVFVRFGETQMNIKDILQLGPGSIIELNKPVNTPVELVVNEDLVIARGEVVVVESNFAIRITEIKSKADRLKSL